MTMVFASRSHSRRRAVAVVALAWAADRRLRRIGMSHALGRAHTEPADDPASPPPQARLGLRPAALAAAQPQQQVAHRARHQQLTARRRQPDPPRDAATVVVG